MDEQNEANQPDSNPGLKETVISIRLHVDRAINTTSKILTSRECALAFTNIQRTKMWLGKMLGELGKDNPYPNSTNSANNIIELQTEMASNDFYIDPEWTQTQKVKQMRAILADIVDRVYGLISHPSTDISNTKLQIAIGQAYISACDAKMWYGWELDRIRNIEEANK